MDLKFMLYKILEHSYLGVKFYRELIINNYSSFGIIVLKTLTNQKNPQQEIYRGF